MSESAKDTYVTYRITLSQEAFAAAEVLIGEGMWHSAVNRLYYASYYMVSALLISREIVAKTHAGVKTKFFQDFVKTGKVPVELGKFYSNLLDWRQKGDYGDFAGFSQEEVENMRLLTRKLMAILESLIPEESS